MKFLSTWSIKPGCMETAVKRFLAGEAGDVPGLKVLGRWHKADGGSGFTLSETDDAAIVYAYMARWNDVLDLQSFAVVEDEQAGPILARQFGK